MHHAAFDIRGAIAVEFALVVPVLLLLVVGTAEVVRYVKAYMVFSVAVGSMAQVVAAQSSVTAGTSGTMGDFCKGARLTMGAFNTGTLSVSMASATNPLSGGSSAVDWETDTSCPATGATIGYTGALATLTPYIPNGGDSAILLKANFTYVPLLTQIVTSSITLNQQTIVRPRKGTVSCSGC